ncbi:MAG: hypothetical protein COA50_12360 [Flavobacteriaceae bacterium]|nr:MAG: hypothetical protein COA50_12360 [Flavobacteriaceae bacterium]
MKKYIVTVILSFTIYCGFTQEEKGPSLTHDFELELEGEYRYFFDEASFNNQENNFPSIAVRPEYSLEWNKGYESLNFKGFFRLDVDDERTHWDIRELYYQKAKSNWEISIGLKKVYWGVTESNHLVDIINQTDAVESFDGEKKLGQPMVQYSLSTNFGTFDAFYLPYHRKRTFAGSKGRFRFSDVLNKDDFGYESDAEEWHQDFALRYAHSIGIFDVGLSHFYGTGREPLFDFDAFGNINAFYPIINQTGLDVQITHNAFLWKLESIYRTSDAQDFFAAVGGVEFTISNIKNTGIDVGLIGEYLYDERDELALNALQNDIFFGSRIAFNDIQSTEILLGGITDLENSSKIFSIEGSRRFGESMKVEIEGRFLNNVDDNEFILSNFQNDSFLRITLFKYF